ncbi:helicase [Mycolicibacter nonchromogenicus]|uniref:Helicase n=1 Tax=Mycolicibacter nonchromogenicus TaxID=1782 RepID=A0A1X1Z120_MYCNO|nr:helicase-related protein [Mycolicibacter nonchromogenicus]ORW17059.1 helicase [Mycolicibacter nonchromogenicus]
MGFAPGNLVTARGREWVVLPDSTDDFLVLRPLGGIDDDIAGVLVSEGVTAATFPPPVPDDIGDHLSASMLRSALRIGFRSTAGPFRSLASIAVEPRAYQLVPLMMALRQDVVRLLIADDVGIGKTIEAALIAAELLQVGDARGLAVLCSPALAEQWQSELREKFGFEAELVLPSTVKRLERGLVGAESIFERYPITVISTDFIKSTRRRHEFLRTCPDLVIVDEVHTCVADSTSSGSGRTQRYELMRDLAADRSRHLILASATPHSGKEEAFRNLLGLLDPQLATVDLEDRRGRETLARHFVQRRRADIRRYLDEDTPFPKDRLTTEVPYTLSREYDALFTKVLDYARETVRSGDGGLARRVNWWSALALLRALASSPRAAAQTLRTRAAAAATDSPEEADAIGRAIVLDQPEDEALEAADTTPGADANSGQTDAKSRRLRGFLADAQKLEGKPDNKIAALIKIVKEVQADGCDPIVFCRFIDTAEYVAEHLDSALGKNVTVRAVTGSLPADERITRIEELAATPGRHVLVATDCLSEGVNLQENFQAVIHYDLAWNPTRHEQREGRVDRFGQRAQTVRAVTLYGRDNQIDGIVLEVLLRKHEAIRKATGVSVPVPDSSDAVVEALMEGLLLRGRDAEQLGLELDITEKQNDLYTQWDSAAERERVAKTKYAQHGIKPEEVSAELRESRAALGTGAEVADFTRHTLKALRSTCTTTEAGFTATLAPLPLGLRDTLPPDRRDPLVFASDLPVARGEAVLNRTDASVEAIANYVLESALDTELPAEQRPARRCAVVRTNAVTTRTTLLLVRYRFHLELPSRSGARQLVAEDVATRAFEGAPAQANWLEPTAVAPLLDATPSGNVPHPQAQQFLNRSLDGLDDVRDHLEEHGEMLAKRLLESHRRVRQASADVVRGLKVTVEPVADILGVFVFVPPTGGTK